MTSEQWKSVWSTYEQAARLPADQRRAFAQSANLDAEARRELLELIESDEEEPPAAAPSKVGHYRLGQVIGRGGMGVVYAAADEDLDRQVALKFLNTSMVGSRSAVERFSREARAVSALNHLNIVTIYDIIHDGSRMAIAMELVEGRSLGEWRGEAVPCEQAAAWCRQIAQALDAAHSRGLMHRDIKPENVLVRSDGVVKVLDFGLARRVTDDTSTLGHPLGTMRYMSPEQSLGAKVTPASDIFSLGIVLYELVTGRHPFHAPTPFETARAISTMTPVQPARLARLPGQLNALIVAMLHRDADKRPPAAEVVRRLGEVRGPSRRIGGWAIAAAAAFAALTFGIYRYRDEVAHPGQFVPLLGRPLTSQPGWESHPALSPDGNWIAFLWTLDRGQPRSLFVKRAAEGDPPIKLTGGEPGVQTGPPAWSPDGARVAFLRVAGPGRNAIYSIERTGGTLTQVADLKNPSLDSFIDWDRGGSLLAFADSESPNGGASVYLFDARTGERRKLTDSPASGGDRDPRFSPDGTVVAFRRVHADGNEDLLLVPAGGGVPRRLTSDTFHHGIRGHDWMPDGRSIVASGQHGGTSCGLWRYPLDAGVKPQRLAESALDLITPTVAPGAARMAWVSEHADSNIWRIPVHGGAGSSLAVSTLRDVDPNLCADGRVAFLSDRSGTPEIWILSADGRTQARVTKFGGPRAATPVWSPDGSKLVLSAAVPGRQNLYLLDCVAGGVNCGPPRRLSPGGGNEVLPAWSADGRSILYASDEKGWNIWRIAVTGGTPVPVTSDGAYRAMESADGKWLYVSTARGIYRLRTGETVKEWLLGDPYRVAHRDWTICGNELVFFDNGARPSLRALNLTNRKVREIAGSTRLSIEPGKSGLTAAPDGRSILLSVLEQSSSSILVSDPPALR